MGEPVALTQKTQLVVASQEKDIGIRRETSFILNICDGLKIKI